MVSLACSHTGARLQAVVFDMDGVIVDSHPAHRFAWREFLRTFGKEVTDNELDFIMDGRKRKDIFFHFLGPLTDERLQEYGNLKDEFFWQAAPDAVPVPGVFEFIECIRQAGITMAVATSASTNRTRETLQRLGLRNISQQWLQATMFAKGNPILASIDWSASAFNVLRELPWPSRMPRQESGQPRTPA